MRAAGVVCGGLKQNCVLGLMVKNIRKLSAFASVNMGSAEAEAVTGRKNSLLSPSMTWLCNEICA